jgi:hypothetical protein
MQKRVLTILVIVGAVAHLVAAATLTPGRIRDWATVYPYRSMIAWLVWNVAIVAVGGTIAVWYEGRRARRTPPHEL